MPLEIFKMVLFFLLVCLAVVSIVGCSQLRAENPEEIFCKEGEEFRGAAETIRGITIAWPDCRKQKLLINPM